MKGQWDVDINLVTSDGETRQTVYCILSWYQLSTISNGVCVCVCVCVCAHSSSL